MSRVPNDNITVAKKTLFSLPRLSFWPFNKAQSSQTQERIDEEIRRAAPIVYETWEDYVETANTVFAALVLAEIVGAIAAWGVTNSMIQLLLVKLATIERATAPLRQKIGDARDRAKKLLKSKEVQAAIDKLNKAHSYAIIISPEYRKKLEEFYAGIRGLSDSVFYNTETINGALTLVQMAVYDVYRLQGEEVQLADNQFFGYSQMVVRNINANAEEYRRSPANFTAWLQRVVTHPLQEEAFAVQRDRNKVVQGIGDGVRSTEKAVTALTNRYDGYREAMDPFLDAQKARELDEIRRHFERDVRKPLRRLTTAVDKDIPAVVKTQQVATERLEEQQEEINNVSEIIADPNTLTEAQKAAQRERVTSWLDNLPDAGDTPDDPLVAVHRSVTSIFQRLEEDR